MFVKSCQVFGVAIPVILFGASYFFFADLTPDTPLYAGSVMVFGFVGVSILFMMAACVFVAPTSFILLKPENRAYFNAESLGWRIILVINWLLLLLYSTMFLVVAFT